MAMKLWHQSTIELGANDHYSGALRRRAKLVLGEAATIETFGLPPGTYHGRPPSKACGNAFIYHRILDRIIDQAFEAEQQGYDGFVIGSFSEPFLTEIRSAVNLPVTSVLETSLLVGCSLGGKLAFVTTSPNVDGMVKKGVALHAMGTRVSDVFSLEPAFAGPPLHGAFADPAPMLESFARAADRALANGADVLIPAEGILAIILANEGVTWCKGAPVMDVFGVTWSYALMLARLRSCSGLKVSRRGRYAQEDPELLMLMQHRAGPSSGAT